jgi:flagellar biogenesis protein FliO
MDIMSLIGALVIIGLALGLTYYGSRWYARRIGSSGVGRYVKIVDRTALSQGSAVYIIKAGSRYHMLGVSDKAVSYLQALPDFEETGNPDAAKAIPFSQVMKGVMGKRGDGP